MKKILLALLGAITLASISTAQTNVVLSRNAVGYIRIPLSTNKMYLLSNPFVPMTPTGDIITNMLAPVANGTVILVWGEDIQAYRSYLKNARGTWDAPSQTTRITRADAFFVKTPASGATTLYLMGEVPDRFTAPTSHQFRVAGITMLGYPYPVSVTLTSTPMAAATPASSSISVFDSDSDSYISYLKNSRGLWVGIATSAVISPGQGVVINSLSSNTAWSTVKPYTWP